MQSHHIKLYTLCLLAWGGQQIHAQQADTLKRQLRVLTEQEELISERSPMELPVKLPQRKATESIALQPLSLKAYKPEYDLPLLNSLSPLQAFYDRGKQGGYIQAGLGLKYNAYLSAGLGLIQEQNRDWRLHFDGRYTRHQFSNYEQPSTIREQAFKLSSTYRNTLDTGLQLQVVGNVSHQAYNYYGASYLGASPAISPEPTMRISQGDIALSFGNLKAYKQAIAYQFTPRISYMQVQGLSPINRNHQAKELSLGIDGTFRYFLTKQHYINLDTKGLSYIYPKSSNSNIYDYNNRSSITFRPYWHYHSDEVTDWGIELGLSLDLYKQGGEQEALFSPYAQAYLKFNPEWLLRLQMSGGIQANSLSQMLGEMPYLVLGEDSRATHIPIDARLAIEGMLNDGLKLEAFGRYTQYQKALNYAISPLGAFTPELADGSCLQFGVGMSSHFSNYFTIKGQALYNHWSKNPAKEVSLYGRPTAEWHIEGTYRPLKTIELLAGIDMLYGIQQRVIATSPNSESRVNLPSLSTLHLAASYHLAKQWSIGLRGHFNANAQGSKYYGYQAQRLSATFVVAYKF